MRERVVKFISLDDWIGVFVELILRKKKRKYYFVGVFLLRIFNIFV